MRVNQPQMRVNTAQQPHQEQQNKRMRTETEVMQLARKIKAEQGAQTAGYFLFAVKPFTAPNEIMFIERELGIHCECDPAIRNTSRPNATGSNMQMMQMMMQMMRDKKSPDPMTLFRMMNTNSHK